MKKERRCGYVLEYVLIETYWNVNKNKYPVGVKKQRY